ncbi:tetrahydroberberine oxidase-like [Primulina huaijiensis]|uniref:tetrahydroberberine oxidase-like n=1 Tax=Primulina huaijiensis TaxID=1492673 RepID=UPI003CC6DD50
MKTAPTMISSPANFTLLLILAISWAATAYGHEYFLECLQNEFKNFTLFSNTVHTPTKSSYKSVLESSIQNLRFKSESTKKPLVIVTPEYETQIPPVIHCAKENDLQIKIRSGGHDLEGLSSVSQVPFMILDMINLSEVAIDAEQKTAWVQSGATLGSLYYRIAEKSQTLGFPGGLCPSVGVGGHLSGGGYGTMLRKYGLAADNVIDARIAVVNGRILDRESMGEDLFWAIRGSGGSSFGVILAWKIKLVDVPERVTVFTIDRTSEQNATQLVQKLQYVAHKIDENIFFRTVIRKIPSGTIQASFHSLFLGGIDELLPIMQESFPELGLVREDCTEMSWIESVLHFAMFPADQPLEVLLSRIQPFVPHFKVKTDYVQESISEHDLEGIWRLLDEIETGEIDIIPYGGRMDAISESSIPFPHRAGNLYQIEYIVFWLTEEGNNAEKCVNWVRKLHSYMTPYVSISPRAAYINYRDLDLGVNDKSKAGLTSYEEARIWGAKYFKNNFERLVEVKSRVDPKNFFRDEQSIPPLTNMCDA